MSLAALQGTPTIVNFFASWCRDCQAELAAFAGLAGPERRSGGHPRGRLQRRQTGRPPRACWPRPDATYPVGVDSDAKVATSYLLDALPVTYFLDAGGRVVHVSFGTQTPATLEPVDRRP